ncbi:MAG: hypothetical protein AAFR46_08050 [Pseudomonadota bacterium]
MPAPRFQLDEVFPRRPLTLTPPMPGSAAWLDLALGILVLALGLAQFGYFGPEILADTLVGPHAHDRSIAVAGQCQNTPVIVWCSLTLTAEDGATAQKFFTYLGSEPAVFDAGRTATGALVVHQAQAALLNRWLVWFGLGASITALAVFALREAWTQRRMNRALTSLVSTILMPVPVVILSAKRDGDVLVFKYRPLGSGPGGASGSGPGGASDSGPGGASGSGPGDASGAGFGPRTRLQTGLDFDPAAYALSVDARGAGRPVALAVRSKTSPPVLVDRMLQSLDLTEAERARLLDWLYPPG